MSTRDLLRPERLLAVAAVGVVALLIFPIPTWLIDGLLTAQLATAVIVLLAALGARHPTDLSVFPSVLVLTTLFRLGLNVSTTRLILARADAGEVVAAFGDAVVAGSYLVGAVVFAVLTVVQYVVIARGAERVAQVAARFALDGLPGRQLAIDADVRAGLLDPEAARARRDQLARESSLYGAMDGAMKFVRGDAIAGLCIVAVNIAGGFAVGMGQRGLSLDDAIGIYTVLTVGDGLVSQLPALLTATAAALVVTRVASPETPDLATAIGRQLAGRGGTLAGAAGLLTLLAVLPGLPAAPFLTIAAALGALAFVARGSPARPTRTRDPAPPPTAPLGLTLHPDAARALAPETPEGVLERARRRLHAEYGVDLPAATVRTDAADVPPGGYRVEVAEAAVARGQLPRGLLFCTPAPEPGTVHPGPHPVTGAPGGWAADGPGFDAAEYLAEHIVATWRRQGGAALGVQTLSDRLARLEDTHPALVRAVVPRRVDVPRLARLIQRLLAEDLPARDLPGLLEVLTALPAEITEEDAQLAALRRGLAARITQRVAPEGLLEAMLPDAAVEAALRDAVGLAPDAAGDLLDALSSLAGRCPRAALLVPPDLRERTRELVSPALPGLPVITAEEILPGTRTVAVGVVRI